MSVHDNDLTLYLEKLSNMFQACLTAAYLVQTDMVYIQLVYYNPVFGILVCSDRFVSF